MPKINYVRNDVTRMLHKWRVVRDCLAGEETIKKARTRYLPMPNETDESLENKKRYDQYVERASFFPVTGSTMEGLLGQVFDVDPVIELPDELDLLKTDATGSGVDLLQFSAKTLGEVLGFGRSGILVDYPNVDTVTREDVQSGRARPTLIGVAPTDVINWRTVYRGAKQMLSLVVIAEMYVTKDDGFEIKEGPRWRVLRCDADTGFTYKVEIWIEDEGEDKFLLQEEYFPKDANGNTLEFIPFTFVGSMNNDPSPDQPPLYGIANLNVKHYRNSADYEDSVYMVGQPTPVFSGLKKSWIDDVLKGKVELGSRGGVFLPDAGTATLLQAAPNALVKEAMDSKEAQMIALGAQLIQPQRVSRTLGEAKMDKNSQTSILSKCAKNTSAAVTKALSWCGLFQLGKLLDENESYIELSTTFAITRMDAQEQAALIASWQGGALTWNEMRSQMRMSGLATEDDEKAKEEIDAEQAANPPLNLDNLINSNPNPGVPAPGVPNQGNGG